ncbi:MAG: pirin family protein [Gammaproteobacteria bacterium]|nr:pirin family protein [Gammaproteobacteria bacterium]
MPKQENGLMEGFQLWINLPANNTMDPPEYQEYKSTAFPVVKTSDFQVKVIIGHFGETKSPIKDEITKVTYLDVQVKPEKKFNYALSSDNNSFLYIFEGGGKTNGQNVSSHTLITLDNDKSSPMFVAAKQGMRFILISGKPINENIVQYGPFVMNTPEEINEAMCDFQSNNFVRDRAWINRR